MRLIYVKEIPHWYDGDIALPIMAGGQVPPPPPEAEDEEVQEIALEQFIGRELYDAGAKKVGVLERSRQPIMVERPPGSGIFKPSGQFRWTYHMGGRHLQPGTTLLDPVNRALIAPSGDFNSARVTTASQDVLESLFPEIFGPAADAETAEGRAGRAASAAENAAQRAWEEQQEAARRTWEAEQDRIAREEAARQAQLDREFRAEQERLAREEQKRQSLLSHATQLLEKRMGIRSDAAGRALQYAGQDTVRLLAGLHGKAVPEGQLTPMDIFKQQNEASAAPGGLPTIGPSADIGTLESAIAKMDALDKNTGPVAGTPTGIGFKGGGVISPAGIQFGNNRRAVMLGEGTGTGTEIGVIEPGMGITEVIPMVGGAQEGATPVNLGVLPGLLQTLRGNVAQVGNVGQNFQSQANPAFMSSLGFGQTSGAPTFGNYGAVDPSLGTTFKGWRDFLDPVTGQKKYTEAQAQEYANLIGLLPAPHKAAMFLRNLLPDEQKELYSAYKLAGWTEDTLDAIFARAIISGPQRQGISLR